MNPTFKYIVISILSCLGIVFLFQIFWLKGLYNTIEEDTRHRVHDCIRETDQMELQMRLDSLNSLPDQGKSISISKVFTSVDEDNSNQFEDVTHKKIINKKDTTSIIYKKERDLTIVEIDAILSDLKTQIHIVLDSIAPLSLHRFDSLLNVNLQQKSIDTKVISVSCKDFENDSLLSEPVGIKLAAGKEHFLYRYSSTAESGYEIYTESLTKSVLLQMSGILITTLLIIILLGIAFWYLINTVIKQKTLEQMKDDFTNNMTHELKTPIAVAYSATDALLNYKQGDDKEKREKYLTICKEQLSQLNGLVEQILSMSMENRQTFILNKEDICLIDILNNQIAHHKLKSDKPVVFDLNIKPQNLMIYADRIHFNNIISNLIDNAIKYSRESVSICINAYLEQNYIVIKIEDNGQGISSENQPYIFDKFYRVTEGNKYSVKGYGLGLFYVRMMIEKHNGTISLKSEKNKGSVFTIKIPT